jgi:SnoaL-like polyketide cyclase
MTLSPVEAALADPTLSVTELANLKLVLKFRQLPFAERKNYTAPGFAPRRIGMANLAELDHSGVAGYSADSIPDRQDDILDIIVRGGRVWATWIIRGTHAGNIYGLAATGNPLEVLELGQWEVENGLITSAWFFVDELGLLRQTGKPSTIAAAADEPSHPSLKD